MGGDLTFTSQKARAAPLPRRCWAGAWPGREEKTLPLPVSGKVLVVDDNAMARDTLVHVLTGLGLVSLVVESCASALEMVSGTQGYAWSWWTGRCLAANLPSWRSFSPQVWMTRPRSS